MAVCRVCGTQCRDHELLPVHEGGGCLTCSGSPACTRCGHPRRHHRGAFGAVAARCDVRVPAEVGLAVGRCGCAGYTTNPAAFGEPVEVVDVAELRLRTPERPASVEPVLGNVRDLFDEGRRVKRPDDPGIPWRPPR